MNTNNSQNKGNSITIDLENLQKQYSNLLTKYQSAVSEYITYLNSKHKTNFVSIKGKAYLGTGSAGSSNAATVQECIASCSQNTKCTGATFVSNQCQIRTGNSNIIASNNGNSYAIVSKEKQLLLNMENINDQLININKQISRTIQKGEPIYNKSQKETREKTKELIKGYAELIEERDNIKLMLNQYEILSDVENENSIKITQNYYTYILLLILALAICVLLYKMSTGTTQTTNIQYGGDLNNSSYIFVFIIIFVIIGIKYFSL